MARQLKAIEKIRFSAVLNPKLLIEFINPPATIANTEHVPELRYNLQLNDSQRNAIIYAINNERSLSLIQGPPGTGKTQVIAEICLQLCHKNPNIRILVCSETHVAVNTLLNRISEADASIRCLRIRDKEQNSDVEVFSPQSIISAYVQWLGETCTDSEIVSIISSSLSNFEDKSFEKALALSANVTGMTCNRVGAYHFYDSTEIFDYVIIDEVCKATLPEILMPLAVAKKAILVGDPKQLPPVFCSDDLDLIKTIDGCNLQHYMYIDNLFAISKTVTTLNIQYRMENSIGALISRLFYKETPLQNGRNVDYPDSLLWIDYTPSHPWPEQSTDENSKQFIRNLDECIIIKNLLEEISSRPNLDDDTTIAIIVPYRQQASELRTMIGEVERIRVKIDTVDAFQGKQANIVIFGVTRTSGTFLFLADPRRLNVALSRARDQIIIVGNKKYAVRNKLLSNVLDSCRLINYKT